ncbi:hypothetical protein GQ457_03G011340 [Hibiscus cannabinus]
MPESRLSNGLSKRNLLEHSWSGTKGKAVTSSTRSCIFFLLTDESLKPISFPQVLIIISLLRERFFSFPFVDLNGV